MGESSLKKKEGISMEEYFKQSRRSRKAMARQRSRINARTGGRLT